MKTIGFNQSGAALVELALLAALVLVAVFLPFKTLLPKLAGDDTERLRTALETVRLGSFFTTSLDLRGMPSRFGDMATSELALFSSEIARGAGRQRVCSVAVLVRREQDGDIEAEPLNSSYENGTECIRGPFLPSGMRDAVISSTQADLTYGAELAVVSFYEGREEEFSIYRTDPGVAP